MVPNVFSATGSKQIVLGSWNIHKLSDSKLENAYVYSWIIQHDIILISEIKTLLLFNVPGYKTIMGNHKHSRHGGIAMFFGFPRCKKRP